jgi:hypothetical protein
MLSFAGHHIRSSFPMYVSAQLSHWTNRINWLRNPHRQPSSSRPYSSGPMTWTVPVYAGPLPFPPAQPTSLAKGTHGSYDGWHPEG